MCPFCGYTNLVREQRIAAPAAELETDEVFHMLQRALRSGRDRADQRLQLEAALQQAEHLLETSSGNVRIGFYRACLLAELGQSTDAAYALIDLTGMEAPLHLRADFHARLAQALHEAGRFEEALASTKRALELMKGHPAATVIRAKLFDEAGQPEEAVRVLEETLPRLGQRWKITFPPPRWSLLLLLARNYIQLELHHKAAVPLENILLQETAAPLQVVAESARLLGFNYLHVRPDKDEGLTLIRHAALLDPENRMGMLDALRQAIEGQGGNVAEELQSLTERRAEILAEIRQVFQVLDGLPQLDLTQLVPEVELQALDPDPDRRTDLMERAARRLELAHFDRGTLYPLATLEDFRRWVVAWRLRDFLRLLKHQEAEVDRKIKLKAAREVTGNRASFHRQRDRLTATRQIKVRRRRWLVIVLVVVVVLGLLGATAAWVGDELLEHFDGRLVKISCRDERGRPPCTLHVAAGEEGKQRFQDRHSDSWLTRILATWLDSRVQEDGTILYPLQLPWGHIPVDGFWRCQGKRIVKKRFSFEPTCPQQAGD